MNSESVEIKELQLFIEMQLQTAVVLESEVVRLTAENYGSEILRVKVRVQWAEGSEEVLNLIAKQPPRNDLHYQVFQSQITCLKENHAYQRIAPAFQEFQRIKGVPVEEHLDIFAKCFASRLSLNDGMTDFLLLLHILS